MSQAPTVRMIRSYGAPGDQPRPPSACTTFHLAVPARRQVLAGGGDDVGIQVHRGDPARVARQAGEQRGVVPGSGADLEHPVARLHVELLEHERHDRPLRTRS